MLVGAIRLIFALLGAPHTEATHERAHVLCEVAVYRALAPDIADDATAPLGEAVAGVACRGDAP